MKSLSEKPLKFLTMSIRAKNNFFPRKNNFEIQKINLIFFVVGEGIIL